ncbi:MAG: iron-containing alcohol dehydrogenase [Chloroflexota bacterium]|nr:iron-containing alcohol dehydrogenase [Chloroflexota bacterium]
MAELQGRDFRAPPVIHVGRGALSQLPAALRELRAERAAIITDRVMGASEWAPKLEALAAEADVTTTILAELTGEPTTRDVDAALAAIRAADADVVIGFGGGSALDTAKLAAVLHTNPGNGPDYEGYDRIPDPGVPVIAIPTTAGTGSEVTRGVAITDPDRDVKMLLMSPHLVPAAAIIDPEPTFTMPAGVTASTGLDALTHGIEAYVSRRRFPITDALAIDAVDRIGRFMARAYHHPDDAEAREEMLVGSLHAGLAFNNASVALVHGMSRPIGAYFHVPHGLSNAMLLPTVMEFSLSGDIPRYAHIARVLGATETDDRQAAEAGVAIVRDLAADLEVPTLRAWGVDEHRFREVTPAMARDALASGSPANNPRPATQAEVESLYNTVISL